MLNLSPQHVGALTKMEVASLVRVVAPENVGLEVQERLPPEALHRNMHCPSWAEIGVAKALVEKTHEVRLHAKAVPKVDLGYLTDLAKNTPYQELWKEKVKLLRDPEAYADVKLTEIGGFGLDHIHFEKFEEIGFCESLPEGEEPKGGAKIFGVSEWKVDERSAREYERIRGITWCYDVNRDMRDVDGISLAGPTQVHQAVHAGSHTWAVDCSSWFSHFELGERVRNYFVFRHQGRLYRWVRLAMGQRQACDIAHLALPILQFKLVEEPYHSLGYIDNCKLSGSKETLERAGLEFVRRCRRANILLNEVKPEDSEELIKGLVCTQHEFIGFALNHETKTVANTEKTLKKIRNLWSRRKEWSLKNYASFVALLIFGRYTLGKPLSDQWAVLNEWREKLSQLGHIPEEEQKAAWYAPVSIANLREMEVWMELTLNNDPCPCPTHLPFDWQAMLITDAEKDAWGAVIIWPCGKYQVFRGDFPQEFKRSCISEPVGAWAAVKQLDLKELRVLYLGDHTGFISGLNRGHAKAFTYNQVVRSFQMRGLEVRAMHVPGKLICTDEVSRGLPFMHEKLIHNIQLAYENCLTGGFGWALERPPEASYEPSNEREAKEKRDCNEN